MAQKNIISSPGRVIGKAFARDPDFDGDDRHFLHAQEKTPFIPSRVPEKKKQVTISSRSRRSVFRRGRYLGIGKSSPGLVVPPHRVRVEFDTLRPIFFRPLLCRRAVYHETR